MKRLLLASVIVLLPVGALAQNPCAPAESALRMLAQFGEERLGEGISSQGHMFSLYVNPTTRTWSVFGRSPQTPEQFCLLDSGTDWEFGASGEERPESK